MQYAFIEFENQKDCEQAYFKMQGVLIDDHRIHVDFSQSVSSTILVYYLALLMSHAGVETVRKLEKRYYLQAQWPAGRIWRRSKS